jgi:uncharacterized protein YhfF
MMGLVDEDQAGVPDDLEQFWLVAQRYARVGDLDVVLGQPWGQVLAPPAWRAGDSAESAQRWVELVLARTKTATTSLRSEYGPADPLPRVGDLSIILDGSGRPRALIRTVEVVVVPFGKVTPRQALAEGEGGPSLAGWVADRQGYWRRAGYQVGPDTDVVWERFKLLYPA